MAERQPGFGVLVDTPAQGVPRGAPGDYVLLAVSDTGVGCDPVRLEQASGFGLSQVRDRLMATYGPENATITIASDADGTCVKLCFPLNHE